MKQRILPLTVLVFLLLASFSLYGQERNKRGMCYNFFTPQEVAVMDTSKVTWCYNWAQSPQEDPASKMEFMPMVWGAGKDFEAMVSAARAYLSTHSEVKVLLGFNEPMMKNQYGGCDLTPAEAAKLWPKLEALAKEFNIELASPALTWGFEKLSDGKIYGAPEEWMNAFIKAYKKKNRRAPRFDYLVLHSYMDYPSAVMWFCDKYSQMYNKKVLLTEFCAWDQDQNQTPHKSAAEQMSSMTQKVEAMDNDPNVAGYAWFMSHAAVDTVPFNSVFTQFKSDGSLTPLGKVYLNMSTCDKSVWYKPGDKIAASEYVASSNYNMTVGEKPEDGVRFNTCIGIDVADEDARESDEAFPLMLGNFSNRRFADYQIEFSEDKTYSLELRILSDKPQIFTVLCDGESVYSAELEATGEKWKTVTVPVTLKNGLHTIRIKTEGNARTVKFYWFRFN